MNDPILTVDVVDLLPIAGANWTPTIRTKAQRLLNAVASDGRDAESIAVGLAVDIFEAICPTLTLAMAVKPGGADPVKQAMVLAELVLRPERQNADYADGEGAANPPSRLCAGVVGGQREVA